MSTVFSGKFGLRGNFGNFFKLDPTMYIKVRQNKSCFYWIFSKRNNAIQPLV